MLFRRRASAKPPIPYDPARQRPVIRTSICTGEQTACLQDCKTGRLQEVMLIRTPQDRAEFCRMYGIPEEELVIVY